jgi:DnaJ-class molecular chaperone
MFNFKIGQILVKKGEGMPLQADPSTFGNLYVKIVVDFPASITDEQKKGKHCIA